MSDVSPLSPLNPHRFTHLLGRKGAARIALIQPDVLAALNAGQIPTVNLNEFLAIDLHRLAPSVAQHIGLPPDAEPLLDTLAMLSSFKPMKRHSHIARAFYNLTDGQPDAAARTAIATALACHPSDVARCWAAQWISFSELDLVAQLQAVTRFAADPHFGVRETAWMAVRDAVVADLDTALNLLQPWTVSPDPNLRRFASELTRPRGVWCAQIDALKIEPWRAVSLLEPLRSDPSRYVQNSVANWLNDASKSQPAWVQQVCDRWLDDTSSAPPADKTATRYIVNRALRTLEKQV
ncbi:MAG: DNA alkylation repair protein [Burkholderiaceae bacterium]|nr:DNA alkylation repair protein [Burkholderiaceae bacterium]